MIAVIMSVSIAISKTVVVETERESVKVETLTDVFATGPRGVQ